MSRKPAGVRTEYIETETGNKVARKANLVGTQHIMLGGKTVIMADAMIRGDLARTAPTSSSSSSSGTAPGSNTAVFIGRYCFLSKGCCLRPRDASTRARHADDTPSAFTYMPLRLGDHVFVGESAIVQAAAIGSHVHVGKNVVIGEFAIIKDFVRVLDDTVIPANMVIPSFTVVAGQPARIVGEVPEGGHEAFELRELYRTVGNNPQPASV
ncbi:dynactin subunit 5 [Pseudomassariella vexata]|uniref:Dynactin subunit 5 n=1 Tax=Pseudomassariella vexata TaxID=1141098 RepID=A0A1Y2ECR1_9PEZI|nr:dynactin subunit 5 [Pseudomassariella vexata]ORY69094.1 dynactin subunit 5 [Pseudomassariella vexata]